MSKQEGARRQILGAFRHPVFGFLAGLSLALGAGGSHGDDLLAVYRLAAENDPGVLAANAVRLAALEAKPQARALLLPLIEGSATVAYNYQKLDFADSPFFRDRTEEFKSHSFSLDLSQAVYNNSLYAELRQADASIAQAQATYDAALQNLIVRVANAYFGVLAALDNLEFIHQDKEAIGRALEQSRKRFEVGLIAITDVLESEAQYDLAVAREIQARNELSDAREALSEITGRHHENLAGMGAERPLTIPEPADMEQWVKVAEQQNLQVLAAQSAAQLAREEIAVQRSGHYPTLTLEVQSFRDVATGGTFGEITIDSASAGLELNVPIFSGFLVTSQTRQAAYLYTQSHQDLERTRRAALRQARDAYRGVQTSISRVEAFAQAKVSIQSALQATNAGYEVGTRTIIELLDAQTDHFRAIRDYKQERYTYLLNTLQLKQAAGILSERDMGQVNGWLE
jgi:type I secretion outer membrane protein, TolC family